MRYRGGQHHDAKRAIAAAAAGLLHGRGHLGRPQRRHDDHRGRAGAGRRGRACGWSPTRSTSPPSSRCASNIELVVCGGSARAESYELVGPAGRADPGQHQPRRRVHRRRRRSARPPASPPTTRSRRRPTARSSAPRRGSIVVADSSKIGQRGFAKIGDLDRSPTSSPTRRPRRPTSPSCAGSASRCTSYPSPERPPSESRRQSASGPRSASGSRSPWASTIASASCQISLDRQRRRRVRVDHQGVPDELRAAPRRRPGRSGRRRRGSAGSAPRTAAGSASDRERPDAVAVDAARHLDAGSGRAGWRSARRWPR